MTRTLSTAAARRDPAVEAALGVFAADGFQAATVAQVAAAAEISTAYAFKLFGSKEALFIAALDLCFDRITDTLSSAAEATPTDDPARVLDAMASAYALLIEDRDLLLMQVHAQSAATNPRIGEALRRGIRRVVQLASERSGAADREIQRFIAYGQLCHLIVTASISGADGAWGAALTDGIRHTDSPQTTTDRTDPAPQDPRRKDIR